MEQSNFVHLHNHTAHGSLLDGASTIKGLVNRAAELNMPAVALTDHANLYGAIDFYNECQKAKINPIVGCEVYMAPGSRFDKTSSIRNHLVLLAQNEEGYHNLVKISSLAYLEGFYYKARADWELIAKYSKGLIGLSACMAGEIPQLILKKQIEAAEELAGKCAELFDSFYLELQDHGLDDQKTINKELVRMSKKLNIPIVATNDSHYINKEDSYAQDVLLCIGTGNKIMDTKRLRFPNNQFYFKSAQEMLEIFRETPEALKNTLRISEQCNLQFSEHGYYIPEFPNGSPKLLRDKAYNGLLRRYEPLTTEVMLRFEYELRIIESMGFVNYFLIVQDIVNWAKAREIPVGPGRGSGAGSLIAYCLGITELDPLRYNLLFERFLNPDRISMPDIDMDFCYERRGEVVDYIAERYGRDRVAQIITFGTMAGKAAITDSGRVLDYPINEVRRLSAQITKTQALKDLDSSHPVIAVAKQIEGLPRHTSIHAAGVVIGPEPLINLLPLQQTNDTAVCTQYEMHTVEDLGLLKMDILGLRTLTIIGDAVKMLAAKGIDIDINNLPLDDKSVFDLLTRAETAGIFQIESVGMQKILKSMRPDCFEDLIALVALYRPGPLGSGMVEDYIKCKHGEKEINYLHPLLEPILKETYGVILYQEQTMKIATDLAGFSLAEADTMRRAIGKKKPKELAAQKSKFIDGCVANRVPQNIAEELFSLIDYFSGYGFNKSHSAAYALISYQTAYLKTYYPVEYMAACLSNTGDPDKIKFFLQECKRLKIKVLLPDINRSDKKFTTENGCIRFGLTAIKNMGDATIQQILQNRPYDSVFTLAQKCQFSEAVLLTLAKAGCLPWASRRATIEHIPTVVSAAQSVRPGEVTLFGLGEDLIPKLVDTPEYPINTIIDFEKEYLGLYFSGHPLDSYTLPISGVSSIAEAVGETVIGGVIVKINRSGIKNGRAWAVVTLEDYSSSVEAIIFNFTEQFKIGAGYLFKGRMEEDEIKRQFIISHYKNLEIKPA